MKLKGIITKCSMVTFLIVSLILSLSMMCFAGKVIIGTDAGDIEALMNSFAPQIKEKLGIDIEFVTWPLANQYEVVMLALSSNTPTFDLVTYFPQYLGDFGPYLQDVSEIGNVEEAFVVDDIMPGFLDNYMKWRGKWVGITFDGDIHLLTYRKDLFNDPKEQAAYKEKYGKELQPPQDYEEYNDIAEFFTRPEQNLYGTSSWYKRDVLGWVWWYNRLLTKGGELFTDDGKARINDEIGVWALENYVESYKYSPPGSLAFGYDETRKVFFDGMVAMEEHWPCLPKVAADPTKAVEKVWKNVGIAPLPGNFSFMPGGRVLAMPKISPNSKEDAFKVMAFFGSPEISRILVVDTKTHLDPWRKSHFSDPTMYKEMSAAGCAEDFVNAELVSLKRGIPQLNIKFSFRYQDALSKAISQALSGELSPKQALDNAAAEWDRMTDEIGVDTMLPEIQAWHEFLKAKGYTWN